MSDQPEDAEDGQAAVYRVLARKYRPRIFEDLIGQEAVVRTLSNAFASGRIAQAYMLTGVRGVGKTTTARLIARALNYSGTDGPSVEMTELGEHCEAILESRHMDVIEMDAASRTGIDDVREIIESVRYRAVSARYKVYIIDEVHMLSKQAFNALLKTLEEPPEHVKFIFATTEIRKVPVTVLSRCQRFDLRRVEQQELAAHLAKVAEKENVKAEAEALQMISRAAEGSVRDALSLLDQAIAYGESTVAAGQVQSMLGLADRARIIDLFEAVMRGDAAAALKELETQHAHGGDPHLILGDLAEFVHLVTRFKVLGSEAAAATATEAERVGAIGFAERLAMPALTRAWQLLLKGLSEVAQSANPLMAAEMVLIRLAYAAGLPDPAELVRAASAEATASATERTAQPISPNGANAAAGNEPRTQLGAAVSSNPQAQATAIAPEPELSDPSGYSAATARIRSFADIVALVSEKRDIKLKGELEHLVRPVRVSQGQVEIALEPDAPAGLPGELTRKLEAWTGERWLVLLSRQEGAEPIAARRKAARDSLFAEARGHPDVRAVLEQFPGAEIVDVRLPHGPELDAAADPDDTSDE